MSPPILTQSLQRVHINATERSVDSGAESLESTPGCFHYLHFAEVENLANFALPS